MRTKLWKNSFSVLKLCFYNRIMRGCNAIIRANAVNELTLCENFFKSFKYTRNYFHLTYEMNYSSFIHKTSCVILTWFDSTNFPLLDDQILKKNYQ